MKQIRSPRHDPADRPLIVIWEATQACPLACRHCRAEARPNRDPGELTTVEACGLMAQVAEFGSPPPLFVITGGDPFQRPDLFELVRHGTRLGLPVAVSPSGTPTLTKDGLTGLRRRARGPSPSAWTARTRASTTRSAPRPASTAGPWTPGRPPATSASRYRSTPPSPDTT